MSGGSSGGGSNTATTTNTSMTELPEWARGYAKDTLYQASQLTDINKNPYQIYDQNRIAGFSPLQEQAQQGAANMQPSAALGTGTDLATAAGIGALGTNYQAGQFGNQFQAPGAYQPGQFSAAQVQAPNLQQYQMGPAERVRTQSFAQPGSAEAYMSPYMQNVVDIQKREAQRQSGIQGQQQQAQAVGAGAFGGSRDAIMRAERERNLAQQMGDIQATGSQAAYQQAQQQFNAEQQARLAAQQANQQAGLTVGGQNLAALLGVQQLGAGQNLQSQLANQQAGLSAQQMGEQSRQFGAGQGLQAAGLGAQYGLAGQQLGEQSRQYGAGLGLQGLQTGLQAAGQLGNLGQAQFGQQMGINQLQNQYGAQQQALAQQGLSQAYQDFLNQQNYPYKQLGFMSDMIRGLPLGQQSTAQMYQAPPSMMQNVAGLGMGAYGLKQLGMFAKGGQVKGYAAGGELNPMDDPNRMTAAVSKLSEEQLRQIIQHPSSAAEKQAAQLELATRASEKQGLASAYNAMPSAAGGGMVAFGKGGIMHFDGEDGSQVEDPAAQTPGTMGNAEAQQVLSPLLIQKAREVANATPFQGSNETEEQGVTREMNLVNKLAGPSPYDEVKTQVTDLTSQAKEALQQGKGIAALSAMGAILQGPNFMRALGGAGQAFADSYKGALAANQSAKMSIAQMNINLANGQRAEKLGLVKDAMANYQAANKNKIDAYKAQQEADSKALIALSRAERAVQPPKPVAAPKPSAQAEGVIILAEDLKDQHPDWSPAKINAAALTLYNQQKAAGLPGVQAAVQGRADVASSEADLKWAQTVKDEVDRRIAAMSIADYGRDPEYRKDPVGYKLKLAETVRKAVLADPNFKKPGSTAAPAVAPAPAPTVGVAMPPNPTAASLRDGVVYATNRGPAKWNAATGKFTPITP